MEFIITKQNFEKFLNDNFRVMSYKLVFMISCLKIVDGNVNCNKLVKMFSSFYRDRLNNKLPIDRPRSSVNEETLKDDRKILKQS